MERWNSEGIPRETLLWALTQKRFIVRAIQDDACLLCKSSKVNEAGICEVCWALLNEEELKCANLWLSGAGP